MDRGFEGLLPYLSSLKLNFSPIYVCQEHNRSQTMGVWHMHREGAYKFLFLFLSPILFSFPIPSFFFVPLLSPFSLLSFLSFIIGWDGRRGDVKFDHLFSLLQSLSNCVAYDRAQGE